MKRILTLTAVLLASLGLAACGEKKEVDHPHRARALSR